MRICHVCQFIVRVIRSHLVLAELDGFLHAFIVTQTGLEVKIIPFFCFYLLEGNLIDAKLVDIAAFVIF